MKISSDKSETTNDASLSRKTASSVCTIGLPVLVGLLGLVLAAPLHAQPDKEARPHDTLAHQHSARETSEGAGPGMCAPGGMHEQGMGMGCSCSPMQRGMGMGMCPMMQMGRGMTASWGSKRGELVMQFAHATVPGIPGSSHLYHIGQRGMFVNHGEMLELSKEQKMELNKLREQAVLSRARSRAAIKAMELDLRKTHPFDEPRSNGSRRSDCSAVRRSLQ